MNILVIPDFHFKPWIFLQADQILRERKADIAVCLMDIPDGHLCFLKRIDHLLFSHAGLSKTFVCSIFDEDARKDPDAIIHAVNSMRPDELWKPEEDSPIRARIQPGRMKPWAMENITQAVGHTPSEDIIDQDHVFSTDVISTHEDGIPIKNQRFITVDGMMAQWEYV